MLRNHLSRPIVAEALTARLRLGTFSWIVTRDSYTKFLNFQPWSRPTGQRSAAHQWAAAHRLRTAGLGQMDSYYERFCETVAMGLTGRVIDLDVAGLEHEADGEKEERARYETEVESEVNGYEETALGDC